MAWFRCMGGSGGSSGGAEALIDHTQDVSGWIYAASPGDLRSNNSWTATQYIPVVAGETLQMAIKGANQYNGWYSGTGGTAGEYVGNFTPSSDGWITVTVPAGANYLRMSAENADIGGIQIWRIPAISGDSEVLFDYQADVSGSWSDTTGDGSERDMVTITATSDCRISFGSNSTGKTNCGSNHGYIAIKKNGTAVKMVALPTNTTTNIGTISDVLLTAGDILTVTFGFQGSHTNINMHIYDGVISIKGSATVEGASSYSNSTVTML